MRDISAGRAAVRRALRLFALVGALAAAGPFAAPEAPAQGMAPRDGMTMRDMMRQMMRGAVPPPGMTPEALPDPSSEGAALMGRYCTQCHDLPSPRYRTERQWPDVLVRMLGHMEHMSGGMMGMPPVEVPSIGQLNVILAYVQRYGMRKATPEEMASTPPHERTMYALVCSQCHAVPSPRMHPPEAWPGIVARMEANMHLMGMPGLAPEAREKILNLLRAAALPTSP